MKRINENFDYIQKTISESLGIDFTIDTDYTDDLSIDESFEWIDKFITDEEFREASNVANNPDRLLKWMENIKYGYLSHKKGIQYSINDVNDFMKSWRLLTPNFMIKDKLGITWDMVEFQRWWFNKNKINNTVVYIEIDDRRENPTHVFSVFSYSGRVYWFEYAWTKFKGIHEYINIADLLEDVIRKHLSLYGSSSPVKIKVLNKPPQFGCTVNEYIKYCQSGKGIQYRKYPKLFNDLIKESFYEETEESISKQTDKQESDKNGIRRKNLYIAFIEWCKKYNSKNTFGSIFDKDAFKITYPFVPEELRYFYRLANPMLCVLGGDLTFFPVGQLRQVNSKNSRLTDMIIFAATPNDLRVFQNKDKKVYRGETENGAIVLKEVLGETFDLYIQKMIGAGDILNAPLEEEPTA